jgi:geranylgeranyl pyrophosphate synthase
MREKTISSNRFSFILSPIREELRQVEAQMGEALITEEEPLTAILRGLFISGGKRLRPALAILASKFRRSEAKKVVALAAAVEMLHTATLVHDDMIDRSFMRRGNPTLNAAWDDGVVVLVGDYLFARSAALAAETGNQRIISLFAQTLMHISSSELREALKMVRPNREDYYWRISKKTASLFAAATEGGALLSETGEEEVQALRSYGYNLGMAFQIMDDILDFIGEEEELGKPIGSDLRQGVITLPVIYFLEENPDWESVERILAGGEEREEHIHSWVTRIKGSGAIRSSQAEAQAFTEKAKEALSVLPANEYRQVMLGLADYLMVRRS